MASPTHCAAMAAFNGAESDRGDGEGLHALHAEGRSQWSCRRDRRARPIQSAEVTERFLNPGQEKSEEVLALLRADLQKHRILVEVARNAEVPQVRGDRIQLQQVLLNLITNAVEAMATRDGARPLRFRSEVNDAGGVIVSVADNGPGIGPQQLEQIFSPLFTTKSVGMGMALSICRSILD